MSEVKETKFDLGEFTRSVVEGLDQPSTPDIQDVEHEERYNDFITILPQNITIEGCDQIIQQHQNLPFSEVEEVDDLSFKPVDVKEGISYKYQHESGIDYSVIYDGTKEFAKVVEVFEGIIPEHPDFDVINFIQIAHYHQDSFFAPHKDIADSNDTATMMLLLNDEYRGGTINIRGNQIESSTGTVVMFNNSTETWHSVEPIYEGERYVLLVWFGRENDS